MKSNIQNLTAIGMLLSGTTLAYIGFFTPPIGQIDDSVIYIYAQCLIYAGSIMGVGSYITTKFKIIEKKMLCGK